MYRCKSQAKLQFAAHFFAENVTGKLARLSYQRDCSPPCFCLSVYLTKRHLISINPSRDSFATKCTIPGYRFGWRFLTAVLINLISPAVINITGNHLTDGCAGKQFKPVIRSVSVWRKGIRYKDISPSIQIDKYKVRSGAAVDIRYRKRISSALARKHPWLQTVGTSQIARRCPHNIIDID